MSIRAGDTPPRTEARQGRDDAWLYLDRARDELADAVIRFHAAGLRLAGDRCDSILNAVETLLTQSGREEAPGNTP
ncbi:MAG TPA: hypothetical protein VFH73_00430 [Polyangia bacterium]|jgi:hypothetical protein|nr:hypothetical protein [Polyangia bacterium]